MTNPWRLLHEEGDDNTTHAMNVPGGVIVRHIRYASEMVGTESMVFVPDAKVVQDGPTQEYYLRLGARSISENI
jgi:hypothetical protein